MSYPINNKTLRNSLTADTENTGKVARRVGARLARRDGRLGCITGTAPCGQKRTRKSHARYRL